MNRQTHILLSASVCLALTSSVVDAAIDVTTSKIDAASTPTVSTTDLAQAEFLSSSGSGGGQAAENHADLFNGIIGDSSSGTATNEATTLDNTSSIRVNLDTSTNLLGYDIFQIDTYFGWNTGAGGRSNQGYEIILTFMDDSTATLVGPTHWEPNAPAGYWTVASFVESGGGPLFSDTVDLNGGGAAAGSSVTATGVKALTFNITNNAPPGGVVVGREIDILGIPTGGSIDAFVNVGSSATFGTAALSTDKVSNFRLGGGSDDLATVADLDGLSVVMGTGSHHVIDIEPQGTLAAGTYPLIDYDGTIGDLGFAGLQLGTIPAGGRPYVASLVDNTTDTRVDLSITGGGPAGLTWTAATDSVWDLDTTENWEFTTGGSPSNFLAGDNLLFDDTAPSTTVSVSGTIEPGVVEINNSTMAYTFNGDPISGSASVIKQGTESVTFNNANDFSGDVDIVAGTVIVGSGGALGTGAITNSGTLEIANTDPLTVANAISGTGTLEKTGAGTLTIGGQSSTSTGDTIIKEGTVVLGRPGGAFNGDIGISPNSALLVGDTTGTADVTLEFNSASSTTFGNTNITVRSGNSGVATLSSNGNTTLSQAVVTLGSAGVAGKDVTIVERGEPTWNFRFQGVIQDNPTLTGAPGTVTIGASNNGTVWFEADNTYTGATTVEAGTLYLSSGSEASPITVQSGARLRFSLSNTITSTAGLTLDPGSEIRLTETPTLPSYTLITASSITGTPVLETPIAGYAIVVDGTSIKLNASAGGDYGAWASGFLPDDVSDPLTDFDKDGLNNGEEYEFGLDPTDPASANPYPVPLDPVAGTFSFTRRDSSLSGLFSTVETSTDLQMWTEDSGAVLTPGAAVEGVETVAVQLSAGLLDAPKLFVRAVQGDGSVFSTNFEDDNGGFAALGSPNDWAWGAPNSDNNFGFMVTAGNGGSSNCWATNLGDGGAPSGTVDTTANSILQGPDAGGSGIDLTGVAGAELLFAAAVDIAAADSFEVLVKEVGTDTILVSVDVAEITPPETADWLNYGPYDISAAVGSNVYLEFRYTGTDSTYIGVYLDDVNVRELAP